MGRNVWVITDLSPKDISPRKHLCWNKLFIFSSWIPLSLHSTNKLNHSCCFQITTFVQLHVYSWLHSAIPSFIPIWLLELFPINVLCVLFGPFPPTATLGRAVEKAGESRCLGKSPKCIQTETAAVESMHSQHFAFSILPFKRSVLCLAQQVISLPSLTEVRQSPFSGLLGPWITHGVAFLPASV